MPKVDIFGNLVPDSSILQFDNQISTPSSTESKIQRLQQRTADKSAKLDPSTQLGTAVMNEFYDADTIRRALNVPDIRLGDPSSSKYNYINAPERKVTSPEDIAKYEASRMALQNFAMGTTPASAASYRDIIANPLTPENQAIYDAEMAKLTGDTLNVTGTPGHVGVWGRQVGQVYNPNAPTPEESLQERLLATGNAQLYGSGKPLTEQQASTTGPETQEQRMARIMGEYESEDTNSYLGNVVRGAGAGALTTAAGIADASATATANIVGSIAQELGIEGYGTDEDIERASTFFDKYKDSKWADKTTGYNREPSEELIDSSLKNFKEGNYFTGILDAAKAGPDVFAQSLAYMVTAATGVGFAAMIASETNDSIEAYKKNNEGKEPSAAEIGRMAIVDTVKVGLERIPFMSAIKGQSAVAETIGKLLKSVPASKKAALGKEIAKKIGTVGLNIGEEASQEGTQYALDYFNREYGTAEDKGFDFDEMYKAQIAGGAAGGFTGTVGVTGKAAKDALTDAAIKTKEAATKAKEAATAGTSYAKSAFQANPDIDADRLQAAEKSIKTAATSDDVTGDLEDTEVFKPVARDVEAEIAVLDAKRKADEPMASLDTVEEGDNEALAKDSENFDNAYTAALSNAKEDLTEVAAAREAGDTTDYTKGLRDNITNDINTLMDIVESAKSNKVGPNKLAKMKERIAELLPLASAQTTEELTTIINTTKDPEARIANIIGSSAASLEQVEDAIASGEGTDTQKALLNLKRSALKTAYKVRKEKLIGGGNKPGVIQWANTLAEGKPNEATVEKITDFVNSQQSKIDQFNNTLSAWDEENNMPWTLEENKGKEYSDDPADINNKIAIRNATASKEAREGIEVTIGGKTYKGLETIATLADSMQEEQAELDMLLKITNEASSKTSPAAQNEASKAKKEVKQPTSPVKAEEPIATQDELDTATAEIDKVIAKVEKAKGKVPKKPVKAQTSKVEPTVAVEVTKAPAEVEEIVPAKVETSIDTVTLNEELNAINDDIKWLELEKENETFTERVNTNKKITALEKKADKVVATLELEGTVGDSILSNEPSQKTKTGLVKGEKAIKLADFFDVKKVYNNLNTAKDLFGKSFEKLSETIELKEGEAKYLASSKKLIQNTEKYIRRFVTRRLDQTNIKALDITDNDTGAFQSLTRLLLKGEPGNYTLPDEVVTAMAISNNDWMVNASTTRGSRRTNEDTNRLLGKQADDPITQEEIDRVAGIDGLVTTAANSIGNMIYKNIGLKIKPVEGENREVTEAKFKTELGLMAMATMEDNNFIEINKVKAVDVFGKDTVGDGDVEINTFVFTPNGNRLLDAKGNPLSSGTRFANKILGTETSMRYPNLEAPKAPRKVTNSSEIGEHFEAAKTTVDAVNMQENTGWEWTEGFMDSYFSMVSTPEGKQKLKELLGWKDSTKVHDKVKPNVNGKNAAIERDMDFMEEWYGQMKAEEKTEMWFPYKLVKNGRFILDTNTFNPQGKKLHRFAINISPRKITKKIVDDHEMSLAMAFGVDIDKQSKKSALAEWDVIKPQLSKMIADGKTDLEILTESVDNGWSHDVEHTMGGIAEFKAYDKYIKDNGSSIGFESRLPIETDAVTSGFILKMLQMPIIKNVEGFLAKGGVFTTFDEGTSYGKQAEQRGYLDAYNTPAQEMQKRIPKVLKSLGNRLPERGNKLYKEANKKAVELALKSGLDGIVEISRNFMKSPFMTFNYGSSVGSIIKAISDDSIESLYEKMAEEDVSEVITIIRASGVGMRKDKDAGWVAKDGVRAEVQLARDEAKKFAAMSSKQRLSYIIPPILISNIESNIAASIGVALDETFEATYGDFIEAGRTINNSFTTMFRLFKQRLDRDIETKQKELGRYLTDNETNTIIDTLKESMPAIETALGDEASKMFIFKTEATNYDKLEGMRESGQGKVRLADNKVLSGQAKKYDMVESYASGAVVPIHYIDGSIQSIVLSEIEALGVHDANMFYADNVTEGTRLYNKGTSQVSTEYSLTTEILNSFNESINAASNEDIKAVNIIYANENKGDPETAPTVESMRHDMARLNIISEAGRKELFSSPIRFEHAAYEGAHYDWNTESKPYEVQVPKTVLKLPKDDSAADKATDEYISSIDTVQDSAIIPDIEVDGLDTKFIAAEVAKTTNKIKKNCN